MNPPRQAAVATSDPRATETAVEMLRAGGNAVDAAVAAAFVLYVVEPQSCGVAGDAFLLLGRGRGDDPTTAPLAFGGSGAVPQGLTAEALRADGLDGVPPRGGRSVTPPGAVDLLVTTLEAHGTLSLATVLAPAIALAHKGFEVRPSLASAAARAAAEIGSDPVLGPLYVPDGRPVALGSVVRNHRLADCLEAIVVGGARTLYEGPIADEIVEVVRADGGYLDHHDLGSHRTGSITAECASFRGCSVWELPAPTQGPAVLHALRELEALDRPHEDWDRVADALRRGMAAAGFDPAAMGPQRPSPARGDTTYLAVMENDGLAVSLITSVFGDFGSHLGIPVLGSPIQNRATMFRMLRRMPSPGQPPHTTIPAMVTGPDGRVQLCLGVAGGIMQPQAQVQVLIRLLCEGHTPQDAIDAPRFKVCFGGDLALEPDHPLSRIWPEALARDPGPEGFGSANVVAVVGDRLSAGADHRRGGSARVVTLANGE